MEYQVDEQFQLLNFSVSQNEMSSVLIIILKTEGEQRLGSKPSSNICAYGYFFVAAISVVAAVFVAVNPSIVGLARNPF